MAALPAGSQAICLVHRTPMAPSERVVGVVGDIARPRFGLSAGEFRDLAKRIDCVVHAAAVTDFGQPRERVVSTNVRGTEHVLELAALGGVPMYHISTAFADLPGGEANPYEESKRLAEHAVRTSGVRSVVVRPSMVVGHSMTGAITRFQGFYLVLGLFYRELLPVLPVPPRGYVDFVPCDAVANVVWALVRRPDMEGLYWVTAGQQALQVRALADLCAANAERLLGRAVHPPRLVSADVFERLIRPVFLPALPARFKRTLNQVEQFARYMSLVEPLPSSLPELETRRCVGPLPSPEMTLTRSLDYWAAATGLMNHIVRAGAPVTG